MWMLILLGGTVVLHEQLRRAQLGHWEHALVLGLMLYLGTHFSVWETVQWQRRRFLERTARAVHARVCWHTCTVVVCADPVLATPFTHALWACIRRQRSGRGITVLVCHTPGELRPLLTMHPSRRVVVVTTGPTWSATRRCQP